MRYGNDDEWDYNRLGGIMDKLRLGKKKLRNRSQASERDLSGQALRRVRKYRSLGRSPS